MENETLQKCWEWVVLFVQFVHLDDATGRQWARGGAR
jgi:hypothetical protein